MPIIGLTDTGPQFPKIGTLRKGAPKPNEKQPGADLKDCFRFDTDSADAAAAFRAAYGEKPNNIRVMLMFGTVEENFDAWKEHYSAGALKRRCDGQTCSQRLVNGAYDFTPTACECALRGLQKPHACVSVGRLKVVIPELARMGYVLVGTTSIHDIIELQSNLEAAAALRGDLRGIPFILSRRPRKVSIPGEEGKRRRMEKWLLSLEPAPDWVRLQIVAMQRAALPVAETLVLPAPVDEDTGEILDDEPESEPVQPAPTTWKLTGYLSGIDARYNELGDFYFKATLGHSDGKITVVAKDTLGERLNDLPTGSEVTLHGYMAHNTKRNLDYLDVQSFDAVPPPIAQHDANVAKDIDADIDAMEAEYAALIEKEQAAA